MTPNQTTQPRKHYLFGSILSGGLAAIATQPFEVVKTVQLCNPSGLSSIQSLIFTLKSVYTNSNNGFSNFFRGGGVGFVRQGIGFCLYSQILEELSRLFISDESKRFKYPKTALAAGISKTLAICITCPLIVLKTRMELSINPSLILEMKNIIASRSFFRGLDGILARELAFSVFQYTCFRFIRETFQQSSVVLSNPFVASYIAGIVGVILSQPFEVIRNRMMVSNADLPVHYQYSSMFHGIQSILAHDGFKGFFRSLPLRLARKPFNTAISWGLYEQLKKYPSVSELF